MSREQAGKPYEKIPEGAPFWKYNVKDAVIVAPVKSYTFSENPAASHNTEIIQMKSDEDKFKEHKCGRMKRRLDQLLHNYDNFYDLN